MKAVMFLPKLSASYPRQIFQRLVKKYGGDYKVRNFNCTNQLRYMFYGQLTSCESLRDDSNVLDLIEVIPNDIYMMGKAYINFRALARIDTEGALFVTRTKDNMKYEIVSSNFNFDSKCGVTGDHLIRLTGYKPSKFYPKELRLVEFCDLESEEQLSFITNITECLELNGLEIANLYRHRWDVDSFFKLIKQNLTFKHLPGCSENAVKTHLWIAVIAYLLSPESKPSMTARTR